MACMMCIVAGLMVSLFVPNGSISKLSSFLRRILLVKGAASNLRPAATERAGPSGRGCFGGLEGLVLVQSIYTPRGQRPRRHFGYMKVRFQKTFVFPTNLNDFIKLLGELWITLGHFGVTFGV